MMLPPKENLIWLLWQWDSLVMAGSDGVSDGHGEAMSHLVDYLIPDSLIYLTNFYISWRVY